jgi:murein DD-endopeptidase MepM/ murein hydrolase activator NlpD
MNTKRLTFVLVSTSIFAIIGLNLSLQKASLQPMPAVAQTASCDTRIRDNEGIFNRRVGSSTGITLRSDRTLSAKTNQSLAYNRTYDFDAWAYGESVPDLWDPTKQKLDAIWLRHKDTKLWVPSAYMVGYPPSNPPLQPNCNNNSQPSLFPNPTSSNPLRGFRHPMNGIGKYSAAHRAPQQYADDLGINIGTDVFAMRSGKVVAVKQDVPDLRLNQPGGESNQFNVNYILIEHDTDVKHQSGKSYRSFYLHLQQNSVRVRVGERVTVGQLIAKSGHNGWSEGPHLHVDVSYSTGSGVFQRQTVPYVWDKPFDYNK